jgi:hypothetical protein
MARLTHNGITAVLPSGFEGRIFRREPIAGATTWTVAHFATFALPLDTSDFGSGATNLMGPGDIFAVLFEYGPESVGRRLFERNGMPRALAAGDFRPYLLRRGIASQAGTQWFFTEGGRPFTLYAVIGSYTRRVLLVPRVNALLRGIEIAPVPSGVSS